MWMLFFLIARDTQVKVLQTHTMQVTNAVYIILIEQFSLITVVDNAASEQLTTQNGRQQ